MRTSNFNWVLYLSTGVMQKFHTDLFNDIELLSLVVLERYKKTFDLKQVLNQRSV